MPLLTPSEKSALEMMLRNKLGSGVGTSALLKVLFHADEHIIGPFTEAELTESYASIPVAQLEPVEPTTPVVTGEVAVEVTESSP